MDSTPLPTEESEQSDSDQSSLYEEDDSQLVTYVVRITPHEKFTFQQVVDMFKEEPLVCNFVVSRETVPREHFHAVIQVDETVLEEDVRGLIKAFLIPFWQLPSLKLPRGFGNKQYNLQLSTDLDNAVSYTLKDRQEYMYEGFAEAYILKRLEASFPKKKPCNFKQEYIELCDKFNKSNMDIREFMVEFCNLKAKYDQMVNLSHAYSYAISNQIKRDKNAEDFVESFLYKQ